ncbi:MAG: glycosyltransferase [Chthoniobacterales bacterium]
MDATPPPLRILVIVNLPWDSRLGAARVWMELTEQWRAAGHTVEKFSLSDAFPEVRSTGAIFALRQLIFIRKAAAFIRKNAHRFDVIDALIGTVPDSKETLGFQGLLVARSVGLYLLYDRFEQRQEQHSATRPKGRLPGRLLHRFTRRRLSRAADRAMRHADLINLPNDEEAACVRAELGSERRLLVQPYGLNEEQRRALHESAASVPDRLTQQRVCFIGMWCARKGAFDWPHIIRRVRAEVPAAQFRFLGTMLDAETVRRDLGGEVSAAVEVVSEFQPNELAALVADCTVGAFPSYMEGFGLAVIEQLAAGLPVIAYDTAGPRDILQASFPDALVPSGSSDEFAAALCRILRLEPDAYRERSQRCVEVAAAYSWPQIARDTVQAYQQFRHQSEGPIAFVQPFSVGSPGGGPRILRALLDGAPLAARSICTSLEKPPAWKDEIHLPSRPFFGRIEYTRLAALPQSLARPFAPSFRRRLQHQCEPLGPRAIHVVPHSGLDFVEAQEVARDLSVPFLLSLHDDLAYTALGRVPAEQVEAAMGRAWQEAAARFVISEALGREYCRRYGDASFHVVTDGVSELSEPRVTTDPKQLRIYFMGLFHRGYERNLRAFLEAITIFERAHPETKVNVTLRCEHIRPQILAGRKPVTILPFADEAQVKRDLAQADLLYMPLHFGDEHAGFARYSLSTKMVTYVGSGLPIVYHGPENSAAYQLLEKHRAAISITTLDPTEIATVLGEVTAESRHAVVRNALALARREFMLADQKRKFWDVISSCLDQPRGISTTV